MPYVEPRRQIFQEFEEAQAQGAAPLFACCIGPLYALHRYEVADEKARIGDYNEVTPTSAVNWPDHVAGANVDLTGARVVIEDTLMRYYSGTSNSELREDNGNKLYTSAVLATNSYASRNAAFGDRDVTVGDWARVYWIDGATEHEYYTQIAALEANVVAGSAAPVSSPFREAGFTSTSTTVHATELTASPSHYGTTYVATDYNGLVDGYPQDVYTVQVMAKGAGGSGTLDGTQLRITSAGNDTPKTLTLGTDVAWVTEYTVPLGDRGAYVEIVTTGSDDVTVGATWTIEVAQLYAQVDVANTAEWQALGNPNYNGATNTKYIITVITGGTLDPASATNGTVRVHYRTNNGADTEGYLDVPDSAFASATQADYPIGIRNVELRFFKGEQFSTGGIWSFAMNAPTDGEIKTLVLNDSLPADKGANFSGSGPNMDLNLHISTTVDFPDDYITFAQASITTSSSAQILDDLLGTETLKSLIGGRMYADYRELRTDLSGSVGTVSTETERLSVLGPNSAENPLGKAVYHAQAEGEYINAVYYVATDTDDLAGHQEALDLLTENDDVYSLVPLTTNAAIKELYRAHVIERSNETNNQWRIAWVGNDADQVVDVYTELSNSNDLEGTVDIYPVGTYRELNATGSLFLTNGVRTGDTVRINYVTGADGVVTYDSFTVDRVVREDQLILVEDIGGPISVEVKFEIWRNQNKADYSTSLGAAAAVFNNRRVVCTWGDNPVDTDNTAIPMFYLASALAGQRAGVPPHAPMTQLDLVTVLLDPVQKFSRDQLNTVASGGIWIVNKEFSGRVYSRHQVTSITDPDDFLKREQSKTTNLDHISRDFFTATAGIFGQANISDESLSLISQRITNTIELISNRTYSAKIGPQMLDASILRLERDPVLRDTVIVEINPALPDPLNNLPITFRVT
jgi:hypothetical protein